MIAPLQNVLAQRAGAPQPMPGQPMQPGAAPVGTAMPAQPRVGMGMPMQGARMPQRPAMAGAPPMTPMPPQQPQNALMQRARGFY